ncbi:hypothetical protein J6E39_06740 [bacterium]|nr:hypothetical protein [bacterium]
MPINNVNSMNKADLVKLALTKKTSAAKQAQLPAHLTMNGSIFSVAGNNNFAKPVNNTQDTKSNIIKENINKSLKLGQPKATSSSKKEVSSNMSAADGKAAANDAKGVQADVKSAASVSQKNTKAAQQNDKDAQKLNKTMKKDQKTLQKQMKNEQKTFTNAQKQMASAMKDVNANEVEINNIKSQIQSLTAGDNTGVGSTSAFTLSLGGAGQDNKNPVSNDNSAKLNELYSRLNEKTSIGQSYGAKFTTLQKTCSRSMKNMNKMSNQFVKMQKTNQKNLQANMNETSGFIKTAEKADQIAQLAIQGGQALDLAGKGLMALGAAMSWTGGGSALIATGKIMRYTGKISVTVGKFGSAAANVMKTAGYAAEGNLKGAIASAGAAVQTGVAAAKDAKSFGSDWKQITADAKDATAKLDALKDAKADVKANGAIDGMTKKQTKKALQAEILNGKSAESARETVKTNFAAEQTKVDQSMTEALDKSGKGIKNADKFAKKVNNKAAKNIASGAKKSVSSYGKAAAEVKKSTSGGSFLEELNKYGGTLTSLASQLPSGGSSSNVRRGGGYRMPLSPSAQKMIASRRNRMASISRMYAA